MLEQVKEFALKMFDKKIKEGFEFKEVYVYKDKESQPIYFKVRFENSKTQEKFIRPVSCDGNGYQAKEPIFKGKKPLYHLDKLTNLERINEPVYVLEGEKCVDALIKLGFLATTSGSSDSAKKADWSVLKERKIIIWRDNDEAGKRYEKEVISILKSLNCDIQSIAIERLNLPEKGDIVDWLENNPNAIRENIENLSFESNDEKETKKISTDYIIKSIGQGVILFHTPNKEAYAQDQKTKENYHVESKEFKEWIGSTFYRQTKHFLKEDQIKDVLHTYSGLARYEGECHEIFIRVAKLGDNYYLDLAEKGNAQAIEINASGWKVVENPPVRFIRPNTMLSLPIPKKEGSLEVLWNLVNFPENVRLLVKAWLVECLRSDTPFPILELIGEQGTAKSTSQEILRRVIDPNVCNLRGSPKTVDDVFVCASGSWLTSFENVSYLSSEIQDTLCILSTGGGYNKRKLYTDKDEVVIHAKRPIVINGISAAITAQDLLDRSLPVELPPVTFTNRKEKTEVEEIFNSAHSTLLGGLLNTMVDALSKLSSITIPETKHSRLIEFIKLGIAIDKGFLSQFENCREEATARVLDTNPITLAVINWINSRDKQPYMGTLSKIYGCIKEFSQHDNFPKSPRGLGDLLRRAAPALRHHDIECHSLGKVGGFINWEIKKLNNKKQCPGRPECPDETVNYINYDNK